MQEFLKNNLKRIYEGLERNLPYYHPEGWKRWKGKLLKTMKLLNGAGFNYFHLLSLYYINNNNDR